MSDPFTWMMIISGVTAAGSKIYEGQQTAKFEKMRRDQFRIEQRTAEIQAKQQHIELLDELAYANSDVIAQAASSGILAYASPSVSAIRADNFKRHDRNVKANKLNIAGRRANTALMIKSSKLRGRAARTIGMLGAVSDLASTGAAVYRLRGPSSYANNVQDMDV